ncbi:alkylation response protein AidB-like acyl-CoA dehydrogenase [Actinocorallia herbida]|uniref:Alkylation response protein AidB-like acyl-CoA dehydrogenase n=1 Tax=Actinocorallia herbida TaxID=58109 RepID=A0A3N1D414_9ACTN|nr:acyl-CoA dehydrogenase family protein [Actinocorallia herbida]ROO88226.1 alkylation response protein AidB-like acyl-CoA dehydrogenase [Actinocorallia herbida]
MIDPREAARELADDLLFPDAARVDRLDRVPEEHFTALAERGLYGLAVDAAPEVHQEVVEILAGGCLATAFVWLQHTALTKAVAGYGTHPELLADLRAGRVKAGVALGGLWPNAPLRARRDGDGLVLEGSSPWFTGWGVVDVFLLAARDEADRIRWLYLDARPGPALRAEPLDLTAARASGTVRLVFDGLRVPAARLLGDDPSEGLAERDRAGLRTNGYLALGVAARCAALIGPSPWDARVAAVRTLLDTAEPPALPAARAAVSDLAVRAAAALAVAQGSTSVLRGSHPERLAREAAFLLVFGTRPAIRDSLATRLGD